MGLSARNKTYTCVGSNFSQKNLKMATKGVSSQILTISHPYLEKTSWADETDEFEEQQAGKM